VGRFSRQGTRGFTQPGGDGVSALGVTFGTGMGGWYRGWNLGRTAPTLVRFVHDEMKRTAHHSSRSEPFVRPRRWVWRQLAGWPVNTDPTGKDVDRPKVKVIFGTRGRAPGRAGTADGCVTGRGCRRPSSTTKRRGTCRVERRAQVERPPGKGGTLDSARPSAPSDSGPTNSASGDGHKRTLGHSTVFLPRLGRQGDFSWDRSPFSGTAPGRYSSADRIPAVGPVSQTGPEREPG